MVRNDVCLCSTQNIIISGLKVNIVKVQNPCKMTAEWCRRKINHLSELNDEDEKIKILEELFLKLTSLTSVELENTACNLDFNRLFLQLTSNTDTYCEEICKSLTLLFGALRPGAIYQRYPLEMYQYLNHRNAAVKILVLKNIEKTLENIEQVPRLINDINLLIRVIETIGDENLNVALIAMNMMKKIGRVPDGVKIIYTGPMLRAFARLIPKNDAVTFRVYEVIVDIAKSSPEGLEASANSGFLASLLQILDSDDVLLQLNTLEALTELASTQEGLNYLEERSVLKKLANQIREANENVLSRVLIPGLMKFFGNVAKSRPDEIFSKYPFVILALFQVIEEDDAVLLSNALDTLGYVSSSIEGKYALESLGDAMPRTIKRISLIIEKHPTELRLRALDNLALIIHIDKSQQDNRILSLTKSWFDLLHDESLTFIVNLCKQPFDDIRQSCMQVLVEIASQMWGQEYIAAMPGLIEFLLDRSAEAFNNCKQIKYQIVKNLSEASSDIFDSATRQQLQLFVQQGPFFVDLQTQVATESTS
ncbi:26S proteasome non-ATPase regulatory subunit 5 [Fopius arisanus]|uniref:26S proteasome non-ATPase regulatory subunit 5 n=1 Tax=Fopius arisanus TaxID=64838 RepID=A0A0C9PQT3_9HYME|nr:PREDICTED: 26S proteasome non-ATPase regulatory subunit 5 [Fopius arisanus]